MTGFNSKRVAAADKMQEDLTNYGTAWSQDGKRIDPMSVYKEQPVQRCALCNYQHGHAIGCKNNPVDIALANLAQPPLPAQEPHEYDWSMLEAAKESLREHMARIKELEAALKLALEALEEHDYGVAQIIIREALAQPAQEPVAWMYDWICDGKLITGWIAHDESEIPQVAINIRSLYTTPPQREWVGLTDGDKSELAKAQHSWEDLCLAVEAKLKEKNT